MTEFASAIFARLLAGHKLNGEVDRLPDEWRPLADRMAALAGDSTGRSTLWEGFLAGRSDAAAINAGIARADLDGPLPEPDADDPGSGWPPLGLTGLPTVELFPVDVLPGPVARLVREGAAAIGCPPDFFGVAALAVAGGTIGRSVSLLLKDNYPASATIFAACVGPPSDGKTPALKIVSAAVRHIDETLEAEYEKTMEEWREEAAQKDEDGNKVEPPPQPVLRRIDVDDITMEALPLVLADNPRGLVMIRDELTAFVLGMNQFKGGKGNDRSIVLKLWSGDDIKKDRVGHQNKTPVRCLHPCLSIVGGLTPDMLGELGDSKGRADGFVDRFLFCFPDSLPVSDWTEQGVPEETTDDWCDLVLRLWQRSMLVRDDKSVPHVARFTPRGKQAWKSHYAVHVKEMNHPDFPPALRGPWGKFREYAGRLALVLALMDHAADPNADPRVVPAIKGSVVERAWKLVGYFKSHARRVHHAIGQGMGVGGGTVVKALVDWLTATERRSFTERDVKQARRWIDPADLVPALKYLAERNAIRPLPAPAGNPKGGRPPSPGYEVNPALLETHNPQNTRNLGHAED